ncbi:unnamed protein product [Meloidogyne enterolobii]|uniref:Uncharacterized protein n=1 Tax=Meloidogyne enterolobii TaxID=390850 RepID=A0ACB0Y678_MELEN
MFWPILFNHLLLFSYLLLTCLLPLVLSITCCFFHYLLLNCFQLLLAYPFIASAP